MPLGSVVHDTAHVTGQVTGFNPDLTKVGFAFYNTIDCTGDGRLGRQHRSRQFPHEP